ncbi:MAG: hypothetical protein HUK23_00460, partial [Sphaerochaetaceae bacterium]|nr:hypothetical protein [Sphaerochaetaceae bacterium]
TGDEFTQLDAIYQKTGIEIPKNLSSLKSKKTLHNDVIERDEILNYVLNKLGI